jgi:hypothetical protein
VEVDASGEIFGDVPNVAARRPRQAEARDLLTPVYGWFTEGFDTLDLKEAKAFARRVGDMSVPTPQPDRCRETGFPRQRLRGQKRLR